MKDVYLIVSLFGKALAQYTTHTPKDASEIYMQELREKGEQTEAYYVMTRKDWVTWMTEQQYEIPDDYEPENIEWLKDDGATE